MRRRALVLAVLVAAAPAPAWAGGDGEDDDGGGGFSFLYGFSGETAPDELAQSSARVDMRGELTVTWTADPATCAAAGRCGVRGSLAWRPGSAATLALFDVRRGGRAQVVPFFLPTGPGESVVSQVRRPLADGGTATCVDTAPASSGLDAHPVGRDVRLGFDPRSAGMLDSRCGGPRYRDVVGALPQRRVSLAALRRRGGRVDLRASAPFTAPGLTGSVRSTVTLRVARPVRQEETGTRVVEDDEPDFERSRWRVAGVTGQIRADVRGVGPQTACELLDACGLAGALTLVPRTAGGDVDVFSRRGAVGRGEGPSVAGGGSWNERGVLDAAVTPGAGAAMCRDRAALEDGYVDLFSVSRTRIAVTYRLFGTRSRCPGPQLRELDVLARGSVPRDAFARGRRRVTIRLTRGPDRTVGAFRAAVTPDLTIELVRAR